MFDEAIDIPHSAQCLSLYYEHTVHLGFLMLNLTPFKTFLKPLSTKFKTSSPLRVLTGFINDF